MSCTGMFCTGCIQLEEHMCESIHEKIKKELHVLEMKNTKVETPKKV